MSKPRVALIGLGLMGSGMARRLLGAGLPLTVYNRSRERAAPLEAEGARVAASPREAAGGADVIVSMVADDAASRSIWLGEDGALAGAARGAVLVDCGTLTVGWIEELSRAAAAAGCPLLDAPVTGSKGHAAAGELLFLVGGSADALEIARPALAAMSRAIVHVGPTGSGALLKLVNNFLCGVQAASLAEAIALIEKSGLDRTKALEVLTTGAPGSPLIKTLAARMTSRDYTPNFTLKLAQKDMHYAVGEGRRHGVPLSTVTPVIDLYGRAIEGGHGEEDFASVVEALRKS
jgi:3-hydroxyisobutyrate dehydrogenase